MFRFVPALALTVVTGLAISACSSKDSTPTTPSDNNTVVMTATLLPQNEVASGAGAAVVGGDVNGTGTVKITFHLTRDASNNVTQATADYVVNLNGFPAGTTLTGAHIHANPAGQNGNIVAQGIITSGEIVLANGSGGFTKNGIAVDAAVAQNILANPAAFYFNVHTTLNVGGAARGQLVKQ
jgi:hypothetical protein